MPRTFARYVVSSGVSCWRRSSASNGFWAGPTSRRRHQGIAKYRHKNGAPFHRYNCSTRLEQGLWAYRSQAGARRRTGPAEPSSEKAAGAVASSTARHSPRLHELGGLPADARALGRSEQQDAGRRRWRCETGAGLPQWLPPVWPVWSSAHGRLSWHHWAGSPVGVPRGAVWIAAPPRASRLEGSVETAPWKRPWWKLSSPLVSRPPERPWSRWPRHKTSSDRRWYERERKRAMPPSGPVGTMTWPIPKTVWSRGNEHSAGTKRWNG